MGSSSYAHLLPQSRVVLVTRDHTGEGKVYVSSVTNLQSLQGKRPAKELKRDKIGEDFLLAYDETKRILAVCGGMSNMGVSLSSPMTVSCRRLTYLAGFSPSIAHFHL